MPNTYLLKGNGYKGNIIPHTKILDFRGVYLHSLAQTILRILIIRNRWNIYMANYVLAGKNEKNPDLFCESCA